jgi:hypothetical protein
MNTDQMKPDLGERVGPYGEPLDPAPAATAVNPMTQRLALIARRERLQAELHGLDLGDERGYDINVELEQIAEELATVPASGLGKDRPVPEQHISPLGHFVAGWKEAGAADRAYKAECKQHGYNPTGAVTGPIELIACICFPPLFLVFGFVWWGRHRKRRFHEYGY